MRMCTRACTNLTSKPTHIETGGKAIEVVIALLLSRRRNRIRAGALFLCLGKKPADDFLHGNILDGKIDHWPGREGVPADVSHLHPRHPHLHPQRAALQHLAEFLEAAFGVLGKGEPQQLVR